MGQSRPKSRISALEKCAGTFEAQNEELASDTAEELRAVRHASMMKSFDLSCSVPVPSCSDRIQPIWTGDPNSELPIWTEGPNSEQIGDLFDRNFQSFEAMEIRLDRIEIRLDGIETTRRGRRI